MNDLLIIGGIVFLIIGLTLGICLLFKNRNKIEDHNEGQNVVSRSDTPLSDSSQFRALVSASRVSGSFERSELVKEKGLEYVADLTTLKEIKKRLDQELNFLDNIIKTDNSFLLPIASGKAAKLQFIGGKFLTVVSERLNKAQLLSSRENCLSEDVRTVIRRPYVIKYDVLNDLVGENNGEKIDWQNLLTWADNFSEDVSQVRKSLEKKAKVV